MSSQNPSTDWKNWFYNAITSTPDLLMRIYRAYVAFTTPLDQAVSIPALIPSSGGHVEQQVEQVIVSNLAAAPHLIPDSVVSQENPIEGGVEPAEEFNAEEEMSVERGVQKGSLGSTILHYVYNHPGRACRRVKIILSHGNKVLLEQIHEEILRLLTSNMLHSTSGDRRGRLSIHEAFVNRCQEMFGEPTESGDED